MYEESLTEPAARNIRRSALWMEAISDIATMLVLGSLFFSCMCFSYSSRRFLKLIKHLVEIHCNLGASILHMRACLTMLPPFWELSIVHRTASTAGAMAWDNNFREVSGQACHSSESEVRHQGGKCGWQGLLLKSDVFDQISECLSLLFIFIENFKGYKPIASASSTGRFPINT